MSHDHDHGRGPSADADRRWLTIAFALFAVRLASRPPSRRYTFGLGSVAAVAAGTIIVLTGFGQADGLAALTVSALMIRSGWRLLRDSGRILLEGSPKNIDVLVTDGDDCHARRRGLEQLLDERFEIAHTTLQVDHRSPPHLLNIETAG